jgi:PhnB protein
MRARGPHNPKEIDMKVQSYLSFEGRCEEAIGFYKKALGAEVNVLMRFKDSPDPSTCSGVEDIAEKVMHACLRIGETDVMLSDGMCSGERAAAGFQGFSLALSAADAAEADRLFTAVGEGGQVQMPLGPTFFSPSFGVVTDRFGVSWMVVVQS